jgi:hypothetical protein
MTDLTKEATSDNTLFNFLTKKKWRIARHAIFILTFFPLAFSPNTSFSEPIASYISIINAFILFFLIYLNTYLLFPTLLSKGRYFFYFLSIVLIVCAVIAIGPLHELIFKSYLLDTHKPVDRSFRNIVRIFYFLPWIFAATMAVKLFQTWLLNKEHITELRQQSLQSELTQLKSQINPHFLFNTLNNINTLIQTNPDKASEVIIKLSDLLRYQLYDSTRDQISLKSDILFLENFLNIEKLRRDNFKCDVNVIGDPHITQIPPFMFIPFIENATKHSVDPIRDSYVRVNFKIEKDLLTFECENSVANTKKTNLDAGGIGLANVKRRLDLLFEGKHILIINQDLDKYQVKLILNL